MTEKYIFLKYKRNSVADIVKCLVNLSSIAGVSFLFISLSPILNEAVKSGLLLCFASIIPSVFPFFILSDIMLLTLSSERFIILKRAFEKLFKINSSAITALICGALCGFPIGVKIAKELYLSGRISKDECERLIGFSNHASPAFVISAVGYGMRGSIAEGVLIYLVSILSSLFVASIFSLGKSPSISSEKEEKISFSLVKSIRKASESTVNICGFIVFFSIITGIIRHFIKNEVILCAIASLLEIGNAASLISSSETFSRSISLMLTAFAVSFSGFSVHLQSKNLISDTDISMKRYYIMKFITAIISSFICSIFAFFI